jgi:hypothetical protein
MGKDTLASRKLAEQKIRMILEKRGYRYYPRYLIETVAGRKKYAAAEKEGKVYLIDLKCQTRSGSAERKVVFDVVCLSDALAKGNYEKAYVILAGPGWSLKNFFIETLPYYLKVEKVVIVDFDSFLSEAEKKGL